MVMIGEKVRFDPFAHYKGPESGYFRTAVVGEVVEINYKNKWFSVEYGCPAMRNSFKFCDIGTEVKKIGRC